MTTDNNDKENDTNHTGDSDSSTKKKSHRFQKGNRYGKTHAKKRFVKTGPFNAGERQFVLEHCKESPQWIAEQLGRSVQTVKRQLNLVIKENEAKKILNASQEAIAVLHSKDIWKTMQTQYLEDELKVVEYHWSRLYDQFRGDMTHTEELQIFKLIELETLMARLMNEKAQLMRQMEILSREIEQLEMNVGIDGELKDEIMEKKKLLLSFKGAQQSTYMEYTKLLDNHKKIMIDLKGTRDQRVKNIEDSKVTFFGWLRELEEDQNRRNESKRLELFKKAMEKETARLGEPYKYDDGLVDQPLLTPETILQQKE